MLGDMNEHINDHSITSFFDDHDMREVLSEIHQPAPETCKHDQQRDAIDGIWATYGINPARSGHFPHEERDHRLVWIDFVKAETFKQAELPTVPPSAWHLKLSNLAAKANYQKDHLKTLKLQIELDPLNPKLKEALSQLDWDQSKHMLDAEKKCRKFRVGTVDHSLLVNTHGAGVSFLSLAIKWHKGVRVSSCKLE